MKKLIIITGLLMSLLISSCSNVIDNEQNDVNKVQISNDNIGYENFISTVYDINAKYNTMPGMKKKNDNILQYTVKRRGEKLADTGGSVVGGWIGKHLGSVAGAAFGNPVTVVVGYAAGRYVGRAVGSIVASYGCYMLTGYLAKNTSFFKVQTNMIENPDTTIYYFSKKDEIEQIDSLGYIHNKVMESLVSQAEKYISETGIDYDLIYNDCVEMLKEYGISNDTLMYNEEFKRDIINNGKEMAELQHEVADDVSYNDYCNTMVELVKRKGVPNETVALFKDYVLKISNVCDGLSYEQEKQYADELMQAIDKSEMSRELKEEAVTSTNVMINSSMYWKQAEEKNENNK